MSLKRRDDRKVAKIKLFEMPLPTERRSGNVRYDVKKKKRRIVRSRVVRPMKNDVRIEENNVDRSKKIVKKKGVEDRKKMARKKRLKTLSEKRLKEKKRSVLKERKSNGHQNDDCVVVPGESISYLIKQWRTGPPRSPEKRSSPDNKRSIRRLIWWKREGQSNESSISEERKEQVRSSLEEAVRQVCSCDNESKEEAQNVEEISIQEIRQSLTKEISIDEIRESLTTLNVDSSNVKEHTPASSLSSIEISMEEIRDDVVNLSVSKASVRVNVDNNVLRTSEEIKTNDDSKEENSIFSMRNDIVEEESDDIIQIRSSNSTIESFVSDEGGVSELIMSKNLTTTTKLDQETEQILREWENIEKSDRVTASERVHPELNIAEPTCVVLAPERKTKKKEEDVVTILKESDIDEELLLADAEAFAAVRQLQNQLKVLREAFGKEIEEEKVSPSPPPPSISKPWTMPSETASESLEDFDKWFCESGVKGGLFVTELEEAPEMILPNDDNTNDDELIVKSSLPSKRFELVLWTRSLIQTTDVPCKIPKKVMVVDEEKKEKLEEKKEKPEEKKEKLEEKKKTMIHEKESLFLSDLEEDDEVLLGDDELRYSTESLDDSETTTTDFTTSHREKKHDKRIAHARERRDRAFRDQAKYAAAMRNSTESVDKDTLHHLEHEDASRLEQHPLYSPPCVVRNITKVETSKDEITPRRQMFDHAWEEHEKSNQFDNAWKSIDTPSPAPRYPPINDSSKSRRRSSLAMSEINRKTTFDEAWSPSPYRVGAERDEDDLVMSDDDPITSENVSGSIVATTTTTTTTTTTNIEKSGDPIVSALEKIIVEYEAALNARRKS